MFQGNKLKDTNAPKENSTNTASNDSSIATLPAPNYDINDHDEGQKEELKSESGLSSTGGDDAPINPSDVGINIIKNSAEPQKMGAKAFTNGRDVHLSPGNDSKHILGHELGHIIQQSRGQVKSSKKYKGKSYNNDPALEQEAENFGRRFAKGENILSELKQASVKKGTIQPMVDDGSVLQMYGWGDFWDDVSGGVSDAVDYMGDRIEDVGDYIGDLGDEALELALSAIGSLEELLTFLGRLGAGTVRRAMAFISENMTSLFNQFIETMSNSEFFTVAMEVIMSRFRTGASMIAYIGQFAVNAAKNILRFIKNADPRMIKDMLLAAPKYALAPFMILIMQGEKLAEFLMEASEFVIKQLIETAHRFNLAVNKILNALYDLAIESIDKVKAILQMLGARLMKALISGYQAMLKIVRQVMDQIWPLGAAIYLDASLGATFGIPVYAGVEYSCYVQRQTPDDVFLFRKGVAKVGLDTGVGVGVSVGGGKTGKDNDKNAAMLGAEAGANAQAGVKMEVIQEFLFPIFQDLAFISFLATATGKDTSLTFSAAKMLAPDDANLEPEKYNTKTEFKFGVYGEASAEARAGVRVGESSTNGETTRWDRNEGRPEELGGTSGGPWYLPGFLLRKLSASIGGNISIEAGLGMEMRQNGLAENSEGVRVPAEVEMDLFGEGSIAANLAASIPMIPVPSVGIDTTAGIKARFKFVKTGPNKDEVDVKYLGFSPYIQSGDTDALIGNASETELKMGEGALNVTDFINSIEGVSRKQRIGLGGEFGRAFVSRKERQQYVKELNGNGRNFGATASALLMYEFEISKENIQTILHAIAAFKQDHIDNGEWQFLADDILSLFQTGKLAPYLEQFLNRILSVINVKELKIRSIVGAGVAADAQAGAGAKVRLHGSLGAGVFRDFNILGGDSTLDVDEIRDLLLNGAQYVGLVDSPETTADTQPALNVASVPSSSDSVSTSPQAGNTLQSPERDTAPVNESVLTASTQETAEQEQETLQEYTGEDLMKLETVKYELIAHSYAYKSTLMDQRESVERMGFRYVVDRGGWYLSQNTNEQTGFFAGLLMPKDLLSEEDIAGLTPADIAYLENTRPVLAFRGSEYSQEGETSFDRSQFANDWLKSDMDPYAVGHTGFMLHYNEIESMLKTAVQRSGKRVVVTGHSLGGSLAKQCALHFPQYVHEAYTFQAPGIAEDQENKMRKDNNSGRDILGNHLSEKDAAALETSLDPSESRAHGLGSINFVSHTAQGDIVHLAGGGRVPQADRRHHYPSGIINGYTPAAHTLYISSSTEFSEQHAIMNRMLGQPDADTNALYDTATATDIDPMRIKRDSEVSTSDLHRPTEGLRQSLIGDVFNPQALFLTQNRAKIAGIPKEAKLIMLTQLLKPSGLNPLKNISEHISVNRAIVNLFTESTAEHQKHMIDGIGGLSIVYGRIDNLVDNLLTNRSSEIRTSIRQKYIPTLDIASAYTEINKSLDSGFLGFGDGTEEKMITDILLNHPEGEQLITLVGRGNFDDGLSKVLRKLQGQNDRVIRSKFKFKKKKEWWPF